MWSHAVLILVQLLFILYAWIVFSSKINALLIMVVLNSCLLSLFGNFIPLNVVVWHLTQCIFTDSSLCDCDYDEGMWGMFPGIPTRKKCVFSMF